MCFDFIAGLFGGGDDEGFTPPADLPQIQRATPIIAEDTRASVRIGADAARKRNQRTSNRGTRRKVVGNPAIRTTGLQI